MVEKNRTWLGGCSMAWTPIAVARCVLPPELVEGTGAADEDRVVDVLQELASVELAHQRLVDLSSLAKSKPARSR